MKNILVVEDDIVTQKIYLDKLTREGFKVSAANSGDKAIKLATANPPDLILLDIMLQDHLSGFDVLKKLKENDITSKIPVFILTNMGSEDKLAKDVGAQEYIVKANTSLHSLVGKIKKTLKI